MKCVVTGGRGFIGSHVATELDRRGFHVDIYDSDGATPALPEHSGNVRFVHGDIRDSSTLRKAFEGADLVYHFAGLLGTHELFDNPREAIDVNIHGALNVLLAGIDAGVKRVFLPNKPNEWNNVYSVTSQAVEKLGHAYREYMGIDARVLRLWNVYGPRQKIYPVRKAIPLFVFQALSNLPVEVYGDGTQSIELLYVEDVARIVVDYLLFDGAVNETFEPRAGLPITVDALARKIISLTGSTSEIVRLPMRKGENNSTCFAHARDVQTLLGESAFVGLDKGMRATIAHYRALDPHVFAAARESHVQG